MSKRIFTVPDIYTDFRCKAGACRKTCCHGWHITLTMKEYYALLGLDCSPELRRRLDGGVYMLDMPKSERYAEFAKNYIGDCKMHGDDGLCTIQCECGEDVLPSVCRYYPRSPKTLHASECSMSASCEEVCEQLMKRREKMTFKPVELEFKYELPEAVDSFVTRVYGRIRDVLFDVMQDRTIPFTSRLQKLIKAAQAISEPVKKQSETELEAAIESCTHPFEPNIYSSPDKDALNAVKHIFSRLGERFPLDKYTESVDNITFAEYEEKEKKFRESHPDFDVMLEQLFVNHVFYMGFPFISGYGSGLDVYSSAVSLVTLYAVLKVCAAAMMNDDSFDELSDVASDIFKMVETSNYYLCAAALAHETEFDTPDKLSSLCSL